MAESIDEFFADDRLTDSNLRDSVLHIHKYLERKATAQETVQSITASLSAISLSEVLDECIVRAAEQLPETHNDLVELVVQLRSQQQHKSENDGAEFDHSLVMALGERWVCYGDPDPQNAWKEEARAEWTNLNYFAALLFSAGIKRLASFGGRSLQMTLKRRSWGVNWGGLENTSDSIIAFEGHAEAAAHWIIICGRQLYDESNDVKTEFTTLQANLAWILELDDLNNDIKSKLQEAKTAMDEISA
ncbi:hypothetical protein BDV95DRAFT_285880 [Massariosphaeria phaeospora]|uniref:Uncharacterized protein n=1 Tax=Massariosphaeria phaeospora TaxID=100035 RepID=A0A7C8MDQ7_9PLEO|nr:hypothetical protein BDV95DRAFT_285880 [Massariosphaeria phaeospora]